MIRGNTVSDETILGTKVMEMTGLKKQLLERLSSLRSKIDTASKQGILQLKKTLLELELESDKIMRDIELVDTKAAYKLKTVNNKILFLMKSIKDATIKKSGVLKQLNDCLTIIDEVDLDKSDTAWIDKNIKPFEKLDYVTVDLKDPVSVVTAPLLISMPSPLPNRVLDKLEKELKMKGSFGTFYTIKKANFLLIDKSKLKKGTKIVDYANMIIDKISRKAKSTIVPIHDFSLETGKYYAVLLIPDLVAKEMQYILDYLSDYDIYLKS